MSFSIGIYDLFAYTIPGFLYLYVIYDLLTKFGVSTFDLKMAFAIPDGYGLLILILVLVSAHLLGHLFDMFAHWFVFRLFKPYKYSEKMLNRIKELHSDMDIKFQARDWGLLFSMLRQRSLEHSRIIDSFEANSIMLRNISFGLFLLAILQLYSLTSNLTFLPVVIAIGLFIFSFVARKRSHIFHTWFLTDIFESSLIFGNSLQEVLSYDQEKQRNEAVTVPRKASRK
jgi:hypothetical protein